MKLFIVLIFSFIGIFICISQAIKGDSMAWVGLAICLIAPTYFILAVLKALKHQEANEGEENSSNGEQKNDINKINYYLEQLKSQKREGLYKQALGLLDFIEEECNNKIDYFSCLSTVNKERSIIFRKLREMEACKYYNALSYINILQHQAYRFEADIWEPNQTVNTPFKEDSINKAIGDYTIWFYPILVEFRKIRLEIDNKLSDWDFLSNGGTEELLYETNSRLDELIKNIDETPFYIFYRKYNVLSIPNIAIKYKDTKPYVPTISVSNTKPNVTFKITIWTVLKVLVKSSFSKNKTSR